MKKYNQYGDVTIWGVFVDILSWWLSVLTFREDNEGYFDKTHKWLTRTLMWLVTILLVLILIGILSGSIVGVSAANTITTTANTITTITLCL